jgi:antitoxin (DNA-binding transcriptional repressor) of toxin-antitoxin stability system
MTIKAGKDYIFTKSGNAVRTIAPAPPYRRLKMWEVERTDGASAGKRMDVPARALVTHLS